MSKNTNEPVQSEDTKAINQEAESDAVLTDNEYLNYSDIAPEFWAVYHNEPFLATVSMSITKRIDNKVPTAYVGVDPRSGEFTIGYNPKFMASLKKAQRMGVIRHELYHVILHHITTRAPTNREDALVFNIAADLAVNSIIGEENLPECGYIPGKDLPDRPESTSLDKKFAAWLKTAPKLESTEYYFSKIKQLIEQDKKEGNSGSFGEGFGPLDEHGWGSLPNEVKDMIKEKLNNILRKAATEADQKNQWGSIPAEIQAQIRKMLSKEVDWRSVVRNFVGRCRSIERYTSMKKVNKKVPYVYPGSRRHTIANFACFIDQSGSVGDEELCRFFGELESLANITSIDTYHFDTEIDLNSKKTWKKGQKIEAKRTRCGGTDFNCVARFLNDKKNKGHYSAVILLTDGYADKMQYTPYTKVLWVLTPNSTVEAIRPGDLVCKMDNATAGKKFSKK